MAQVSKRRGSWVLFGIRETMKHKSGRLEKETRAENRRALRALKTRIDNVDRDYFETHRKELNESLFRSWLEMEKAKVNNIGE